MDDVALYTCEHARTMKLRYGQPAASCPTIPPCRFGFCVIVQSCKPACTAVFCHLSRLLDSARWGKWERWRRRGKQVHLRLKRFDTRHWLQPQACLKDSRVGKANGASGATPISGGRGRQCHSSFCRCSSRGRTGVWLLCPAQHHATLRQVIAHPTREVLNH